VKLLKKHRDAFTFDLPAREKLLLLAVLDRYPAVPATHQFLGASTAGTAAEQRLLDEALADQRRENKRHLKALLKNERRMKPAGTGFHWVLTAADIEWLLQVLNDIRVGSWIHLGSPEKDLRSIELSEDTVTDATSMELAGFFQAALLEALNSAGAG